MAGKSVKSFSCPACGGSVKLRAAGHSVTAVCDHCASLIDTANENFTILKKYNDKLRPTPIDIGAKATLDGIKWEVIGYTLKSDSSAFFSWDEYLLFNPYHGFRFLVQCDGHWNLAKVIKRNLISSSAANSLMLDGEEFSVYHRGQAKVAYVKGEFYWRVKRDDMCNFTDYIAPPKLLSIEESNDEMTVSMAQYMPVAVIEDAFDLVLDKAKGIAPNQPPPFANQVKKMWLYMLAFFIVAFLIQMFSGGERLLNKTDFHFDASNRDKSFSTAVFNINKRSNVLVSSDVPLDNSWMTLNLSLVNETKQTAILANQGMEYYSGVDDGERWSEGSTHAETFFSGVEPGPYRLVVAPLTDAAVNDSKNITLSIKNNVSVWSNFWFIVFCVLIIPIYVTCHRWYFEYRRWKDSDYAPAIYSAGTE